jgi:hypothetical protein
MWAGGRVTDLDELFAWSMAICICAIFSCSSLFFELFPLIAKIEENLSFEKSRLLIAKCVTRALTYIISNKII